jgi:hypothetical protein
MPVCRKLFVLIGVLVLTAPTLALSYGSDGGDWGPSSKAGATLNNATTTALVNTLRGEVDRCQSLPWTYRYDCYRAAYKVSQKTIAGNRAYDDARKVLKEVEKKLAATVKKNLDRSAPRQRRGVQTFRSIKPEAREIAKRDFVAALEQAETKLLRSAGTTNPHFVKIASALNSNKVLIRSARAIMDWVAPFFRRTA